MVQYVKAEGKRVALEPASADLDLFFKPHPVTGDVTIKKDTDAVRRAVKNLLLTNKYERPFKPNLGGSLNQELFELDTTLDIKLFKKKLEEQVRVLEPRVKDMDILLAEAKNNQMNVSVRYTIKNGERNNLVEFTVNRVR